MSTYVYDGGPAFPVKRDIYDKVAGVTLSVPYNGLTIRDWFAGQALAGLVTEPRFIKTDDAILATADAAYALADAMLKKRGVTP